MKSFEGILLAASPYVNDGDFARAVVLVLRHDDQGAIGLILNRPLKQQVQRIWERICGGKPCPSDLSVNYGGPLSGPLLAIHQPKRLSEYQFSAGVYLTSERKQIGQLLQRSKDPLRLYLGHAEWKPGKLEDELNQGYWMAIPASLKLIFSDDDDLWSEVVRDVGRSIVKSLPGVKEVSGDPTRN
jgi:putative transcriptional regulator